MLKVRYETIVMLFLALQLSAVALAQTASPSAPPAGPQIADVRSGELHLKGYFWKPAGPGPFPAILFNHGSGADDPQHTAGRTMAEAASDLAPIFLKHGYAFFYLCRRGQGLSADQGPFMQALLKQAETKGADARRQLHYQLITGSQLDDALAGLTFLKAAPDADPKRIAIIINSSRRLDEPLRFEFGDCRFRIGEGIYSGVKETEILHGSSEPIHVMHDLPVSRAG